MEAFQVVCMQDVSRRADDFLQDIQVGLVGCDQVAATHRRHLPCKLNGTSNMLVHRNPTWRRGAGAAAFSAVLDIDLVEDFSLTAQPWQVG
ncbi:hypothetical protein D3C72_2084990 [compost metagenome]